MLPPVPDPALALANSVGRLARGRNRCAPVRVARDAGLASSAGTISVVDRIKAMYILGGENASRAGTEDVIDFFDQVSQRAGIGVADPWWGAALMHTLGARPAATRCRSAPWPP